MGTYAYTEGNCIPNLTLRRKKWTLVPVIVELLFAHSFVDWYVEIPVTAGPSWVSNSNSSDELTETATPLGLIEMLWDKANYLGVLRAGVCEIRFNPRFLLTRSTHSTPRYSNGKRYRVIRLRESLKIKSKRRRVIEASFEGNSLVRYLSRFWGRLNIQKKGWTDHSEVPNYEFCFSDPDLLLLLTFWVYIILVSF